MNVLIAAGRMTKMGAQVELATKRLFDREALDANNLKLFPGTIRDTSAEHYSGQINKAISQIEANDFEEVDLETAD
jgi:hypothetical protein